MKFDIKGFPPVDAGGPYAVRRNCLCSNTASPPQVAKRHGLAVTAEPSIEIALVAYVAQGEGMTTTTYNTVDQSLFSGGKGLRTSDPLRAICR